MVARLKYWFFSKRLIVWIAVKITKNADPCKYICTGYGIGFDLHSEISLPDGSMGQNVIVFGVDMGSSVHIWNKNKIF